MTRRRTQCAPGEAVGHDIRGLTLDPVLPFSALLRPPRAVPDFHSLLGLSPDDAVLPTYSGTTALYLGLKSLGIGPGDRVLVPAYNCGHEVEAVLRTGAELECYRVGIDLQADLDELRRLLQQPARVVMVTHYFGFSQPMHEISRMCRDAGALLLEDAVPALFSKGQQGPLGSIGDIAAFSFRKSLPIPVGGALVFRKAIAPALLPALSPPPLLSRGRRVSLLAYKAFSRWKPGAIGRLRWLTALGLFGVHQSCVSLQRIAGSVGWTQHDLDSEDYAFPDQVLGWGMDRHSQRVLAGFEPDRIAARRREFFNRLHATIDHDNQDSIPLPAAGPGTVPLHFVVMTQNRATLLAGLRRCQVPALSWWSEFHPSVNWERFPEAVQLKQQLVALPVHQDLSEQQVCGMATRLQRQLRQIGTATLSMPENARPTPVGKV